jgi:hypothetical protein
MNVPFNDRNPKPFNRSTIMLLAPSQTGVYGLFNSVRPVYVGRGEIRQRLLDHLNGDNSCITRNNPTTWLYEVTWNDEAREKELILECQPSCNQRVG